jgi:hypothetical protein
MAGFIIPAIIGGISSLVGGAMSSKASTSAANAQVDATKYAAELQSKSSAEALALQKQIWEQQQESQKPWIGAGTNALAQLQALLAPGGALTQSFSPASFDSSTVQMDPGFQFRLAEGKKAIERSAAARGGALGGGALKALTRYAQDYSSGEYGNAYNRARGAYQQDYTNAFNTFQANRSNQLNPLLSLAGLGQTATTTLGNEGGQFAQGAAANLTGTGNNLANLATQAGNARASGYVGNANAWNGALTGVGNNLQSLAMLSMLKP